MTKTILMVDGMMCGVCRNKVETALENLEGVTEVNINTASGKTEVIHSEDVTPEMLIAAVVDTGFSAKVKHGLFG
jgi:copper chaperone CopZ